MKLPTNGELAGENRKILTISGKPARSPELQAVEVPGQSQYDTFLRLYTRHEPSLRGFIRSLVPSRDDALDVLQDVAVVLWRKWGELDSPDNFQKWAFKVARIQVLTWRRDLARDRHVFQEDVWELLADDSAVFHEKEQREQQREALEKCLDKLPDEKRLLVRRAYNGETRIDALAEELGRTPMSIYKVLHRLRFKLQECTERYLAQGRVAI
ncbi:MAG: sigma-70 family RNA polymerase sigma factor [Verrucomicrobiota bacterium]